MTSHRTIAAVCGIAFAAILLTACDSTLSYKKAVSKNLKNSNDQRRFDDARFVIDAASYNLLATGLAEEASTSGYSAAIVTLAKENLEHHQSMRKELKRLARKEKIKLPGQMSDNHQALLNQLKNTDRRSFDEMYIRIMNDITEESRTTFSQLATAAQSAEIRSFAARELGTFDSHKSRLKTVETELLRTY